VGIGSEAQYINLTISNYTLGESVMAFYDLGPINQMQLGSLTGAYGGEVTVSSNTGTLWIILQTKGGPVPVTGRLSWQSSPTSVSHRSVKRIIHERNPLTRTTMTRPTYPRSDCSWD